MQCPSMIWILSNAIGLLRESFRRSKMMAKPLMLDDEVDGNANANQARGEANESAEDDEGIDMHDSAPPTATTTTEWRRASRDLNDNDSGGAGGGGGGQPKRTSFRSGEFYFGNDKLKLDCDDDDDDDDDADNDIVSPSRGARVEDTILNVKSVNDDSSSRVSFKRVLKQRSTTSDGSVASSSGGRLFDGPNGKQQSNRAKWLAASCIAVSTYHI